jgi:hypothetical protein
VDSGLDIFGKRDQFGTQFGNQFSLPDSVGAGAAVLLLEQRLTLTGIAEYVTYSNLVDGYVAGVNALTGFDAQFDIDDAVEYRIGGEYVYLSGSGSWPPLAFRAGAFSEEATAIAAVDTGTGAYATEAVFPGADRLIHGTVGLGVAFERVKLDAAADLSSEDNEYVVSVIYRPRGRTASKAGAP